MQPISQRYQFTPLKNEERAWLKNKDEMCQYIGMGTEGGSMDGAVISSCEVVIINRQLDC